LDCAFVDIFYYFEMKGLVDSGHLWTGWFLPNWKRMLLAYVYSAGAIIPRMVGYVGPFAYGKPFDGAIIWLNSEDHSASLRHKEFQKLMKFIGQWQEDYLDPCIQRQLPIEAFANLESPLWFAAHQSLTLSTASGPSSLRRTSAC